MMRVFQRVLARIRVAVNVCWNHISCAPKEYVGLGEVSALEQMTLPTTKIQDSNSSSPEAGTPPYV